MSGLDWGKAKRRKRQGDRKRQRTTKAVHPNSTAARKWGRKTWSTSG